ncbi:MAG: hypothetical protein HKN08_12225 [Gammaproteobacteria bacterium]|nr:hypothetical protein [Gammaproteobacteria bacterium]
MKYILYMRKTGILLTGLVFNIFSQGLVAQDVPGLLINYPDTIFHNAVVVTLDNHDLNADPGTIAESIAVADSVIVAVGTNQDILSLAGPETDVVDLQGKMVLPGIVESHTHPMGKTESIAREMFGLRSSPTGFDLRMDIAATPDETMAKVARAMQTLLDNAEPGPDDWISIALVNVPEYGFSSSSDVATLMSARKMEDVRISKSDISEIVPDYPFMLTSGEEIFGKTGNGLTPESRQAVKQKNVWYHITVDAHGEPVTTPLIEISE